MLADGTYRADMGSDASPWLSAGLGVVEAPRWMRCRCHRRPIIRQLRTQPRSLDQAKVWFDDLASGSALSIRALARREKVHERDISRVLQLAFLAPDIVEAILAGRHPQGVTVYFLKRLPNLPGGWSDQRRLLGFAA